MRNRQLRKRLISYLLVSVVILPACGGNPLGGVNVKSVTADLVFGIPPLDEPVGPAGLDLEEPPVEFNTGQRRPPRSPRPAEEPLPCPDAPLNEVLAEAPTDIGDTQPPIGLYRWTVRGPTGKDEARKPNGYWRDKAPKTERELEPFTYKQVTEISEFEGRAEIDFQFTVESREPFPGGDIVRQVYDVDKDTGIYLSNIIRHPGKTNERPFQLQPPILIFPFPGRPPQQIQGRAVNGEGSSGDVIEITGFVTAQKNIDACGRLVRAIGVDAKIEYTYERTTFVFQPGVPAPIPSKETVTEILDYNYFVATTMGGMIVFEHIENPPCSHPENDDPEHAPADDSKEKRNEKTGRCEYRSQIRPQDDNVDTPDRPYYEYDTGIGQLVPDPLPSPSS